MKDSMLKDINNATKFEELEKYITFLRTIFSVTELKSILHDNINDKLVTDRDSPMFFADSGKIYYNTAPLHEILCYDILIKILTYLPTKQMKSIPTISKELKNIIYSNVKTFFPHVCLML